MCLGGRVPKRSDAFEWRRFARADLATARLLLTDTGRILEIVADALERTNPD